MEKHSTNICKGELNDEFPYRELIGSLLYLSILTRPDITYAVGVLSRHLENPLEEHIIMSKRILRYLRGTMNYGLLFNKSTENIFKIYSDSDYASDIENRRSTSGTVAQYGKCTVAWRSQQQKCVAVSTTEAEYVAASESVKDILWLKRFLKEIDISPECLLYIDNQSAIKIIKNPEYHTRTKHIEVRFHFIREKFNDQEFFLEYI